MAYTTSATLLQKIKNGDEKAWQLFYENYYRLICSIGHRYGFTNEQCQDLVQQVMLLFFQNQKKFTYQPELGAFRSYLWTITRNVITSIQRENSRQKNTTPSDLEELSISDENTIFEQEWHKYLMQEAMNRLRTKVGDTTFDAFQMYVLQERKPEEVAEALHISVPTVYVHKNRCITYLKQIIKEIQVEDPDFTL